MKNIHQKTKSFLPNLCVMKSIIRILIITQILAIIIALTSADNFTLFINSLFKTSLFVLASSIASIMGICFINRLLKKDNALIATLTIIAISLVITLIISLIGLIWIQDTNSINFTAESIYYILKNIIVSSLVSLLIVRYFYIYLQWENSVKVDSSARYTALQSRMRPHFLFNSLNTVAQLTTVNPTRAEEAILDLADIFRSTLDTRERITLGEELDVTIRYLRMEGLRLGKRRLTVVWDMDRNSLPFDMPIPPLLLQPLVENAIYHGIQPRKDGGTLGISLYDAGDHLMVSVSNPVPPTGTNTHQKGNHIAQENLKNRLQIAYGKKANLKITKAAEQYRVAFTIPKE